MLQDLDINCGKRVNAKISVNIFRLATDICTDIGRVPPGEPLHRLLRAAADLGGQPNRAAAQRRLLRRGDQRRRGPLRLGRVRHLPARVLEGIPDRGRDERTVHVRLGNYQGSRWEYCSL